MGNGTRQCQRTDRGYRVAEELRPLANYAASSGRLEPVWTLEIQTVLADVDRILDAIVAVNPLRYGRYTRNASVTATGIETAKPEPGSTTSTHSEGFEAGGVENYPVVEVKVSIERDLTQLEAVMDAVLQVHSYEEPVIFVREDWVSRAAYNPDNDNPNRWWNNGRGLPAKIESIGDFAS